MITDEGTLKDNQKRDVGDNDPRKLSFRYQVLKVLTHPGVVTALVTTVFGTLAVAVATSWVTKVLGERELQFKVVETLIEYTKDHDLENVPAISKLDALTRLIGDNKQFNIRVDGFQTLIKEFKDDELRDSRQKVEDSRQKVKYLEAEQAALEKQLSQDTVKDTEKKVELEREISLKNQEIRQALKRQKSASRKLDAITQSSGQLQATLKKKDDIIDEQKRQIKEELLRADKAEMALKTAREPHVVRFNIKNEDHTDCLIAIQFSDAAGNAERLMTDPGFYEVTFPGSEDSISIERSVYSTEFLQKQFFTIANTDTDKWAGTVTVLVDNKKKFSVFISNNDELQEGSRSKALSHLLSSNNPVKL